MPGDFDESTPTRGETAALNFSSRAERRRAQKEALRREAVKVSATMPEPHPRLTSARIRLRKYITPGTNLAELYGTDRETVGRRFAADLSLVLEALDDRMPKPRK